VCWSDECSIEQGRGKRGEWCFRTPAQKWNKEMVQTYGTGKNMKIMVWGAFWDTGRGGCYIIDRDFESAKHRYSARSYLEVCEAEVAPIFEELDNGYLFIQDNASIHRAYSVRDWFTRHGITQIGNWPAYSPDLNPIEHIWWHLKVRVYEMFPEVATDKSESEYARQRLESYIQAAWDTLDKGLFDSLYESMPARIKACIAASGWHTKY
jgi:DDE superfamily endonuclease